MDGQPVITNGPNGGVILSCNVGINCNSPAYTLDVNGSIHAGPYIIGGSLVSSNGTLQRSEVALWAGTYGFFDFVTTNLQTGNDGRSLQLLWYGCNAINTPLTLMNMNYCNALITMGVNINAPGITLTTDYAVKTTTTAWTTSSDRRIKNNIVDADLVRCLEIVDTLPLRYFEWDTKTMSTIITDTHSLGFIAQEVYDVFPKAVTSSICYGFDDFLLLNADQIFKVNYGATKQLIHMNKEQESTIQGQQVSIQTLFSTTQGLQTTYDTLTSTLMGFIPGFKI
jgi:hypothetical protein